MLTEPTPNEYDRFFELSNPERDLTPVEEAECYRLELLVDPWLYALDSHNLAIEASGLISVPEPLEAGGTYTRWITDRFAVIPEHRQRRADLQTRFLWAILPLDEEPHWACSLVFEDGKFRRDEPELLNWPFHVWVYHSILSRNAYKQHFGSEFPSSLLGGDDKIEEWISLLNG